jgi:RNA polymerase sigma-70 factor (ECF subfamily)
MATRSPLNSVGSDASQSNERTAAVKVAYPAAVAASDVYSGLDALLEGVGRGNADCFRELYRISSPTLFHGILRVVRNGHEGEEILQDVYVKVWERARQFDRRKGRAIGWLLAVARHAAIDALIARKRRPHESPGFIYQDEDPFAGIAAQDPHPDEQLSVKRRAEAVQRGIAALTNDQRESLILAYYHGMSHSQIALRLRRPLGTVKSGVRRALVAMRADLLDHR